MFYESKNSQKDGLIMQSLTKGYNFPSHMHDSFELIWVVEGTMHCKIGQTDCIILPGNAVLIFPNQIHSLLAPDHAIMGICIFSQHLVKSFTVQHAGTLPKSNLFTPDQYLLKCLSNATTLNEFELKGTLYSICGQFALHSEFYSTIQDASGLLHNIISFVEKNYNNDCSLSALAHHVGYHTVYLSRYFYQSTGVHYTEYVNRHRINEAIYLLKNIDSSVLDIAYCCGFQSLRSFNRNFKQIVGVAPTEYQKRII